MNKSGKSNFVQRHLGRLKELLQRKQKDEFINLDDYDFTGLFEDDPFLDESDFSKEFMHLLHEEDEDFWEHSLDGDSDVIRSVFKELEIFYHDYKLRSDVQAFEMGLTVDGKILRMRVYLEEDPRVCRIDAVYPFLAEPKYAYPLCLQLIHENYSRRYGGLQYDETDNELSYQYSFFVSDGLKKEVFRNAFLAVVSSAYDSFDAVKQYAVGSFCRMEREEIIGKAQQLIFDLNQ